MKRSALAALIAVLLAALTAATGCSGHRQLAVCLLVDPTSSAADGRPRFMKGVDSLLTGGYLVRGRVAVIRVDDSPSLLYAGPGVNAVEIKKAVEEASRPSECGPWVGGAHHCGTDPAGAFELARDWLDRSEPGVEARRLLIAFSDCVNDSPCPLAPRRRIFRDPSLVKWSSTPPELHLFGLDAVRMKSLRATWPSTTCMHLANEALEMSHLGLRSSSF